MTFSYDPPERSMADLMSEFFDAVELSNGTDPAANAAKYLHSKLLLHKHRHRVTKDEETQEVVLSMPPDTALWLAQLVADNWTPRRSERSAPHEP